MNTSDLCCETWRTKFQATGLEKLQEEIQRQLAPVRQMQEMHDMLQRYSPEYQMKELLKQFDPHRQILEMLERTSMPKPVRDMLDSNSIAAQTEKMMDKFFQKNPLGISEEAWRRTTQHAAISEAVKQHEQHLKPLLQQQEWLEKFQRQALGGLSSQDFVRQIELASPAIASIEAAKKSLDGFWGQLRQIDFSQLSLNEEDEQHAERAVHSIGMSTTEHQTLQGAVDQIIAAIHAERKPAVQFMLWVFFRKVMDWTIAGVIGVAIANYAPAVLGDSPQAANKAVKELAREVIGAPELLMEYRYVSATVLIVRQNPKALSPEVGRLKFGKPVKLVQKDKDFALVHWTDTESGAEIQGWVFARYLQRFN